jgi:hypothetical protein
VIAKKPEIATAAATVTPNSRNSRPVVSVRNASGRNTAIVETVAAITANRISFMPRRAASMRGVPSSIQRVMFSSTTIASSTTRPIASVTPSSVSVLIVKPSAYSTANAQTETGIATAGSVARAAQEQVDHDHDQRDRLEDRARTSSIERSTKIDESKAISVDTPSGSSVEPLGELAPHSAATPSERVRLRLLHDAERDRGHAVEAPACARPPRRPPCVPRRAAARDRTRSRPGSARRTPRPSSSRPACAR